MRLEDIARIGQGIPLNRIRIEKDMGCREETVYSFEKESRMLIPLIEESEQKIPLAKENMILINLTSYTSKKLGKEDEGKVIPSNYIIIEIRDENEIDPDFLEWYIDKSQGFARALHKIKQGSSILSIPINELRRMKVRIPNIKYQRNIGAINRLNRLRDELYRERKQLTEQLLLKMEERIDD